MTERFTKPVQDSRFLNNPYALEISYLLRRHKLTQREAAKLCGISPKVLSSAKNGRMGIDPLIRIYDLMVEKLAK